MVLQDHRLRPGAAGRPGRPGADLAGAGHHRAAQLDRPVRGRPRRLRRRGPRRAADRLHDPARTRCSARPSWSSRPTRRWPPSWSPTSSGAAFEAYLDEVRKATEIDRLATDRPKTGVFLGVHATNPVTGSRIPVYAADYVLADYGTGAIMAVPGPGPARLGLREGLRPADRAHGRSRPTDWEGEAYTGDGPGDQLRQRRDRPGRAWTSTRPSPRSSPGWSSKGPGHAARSTSGCATGCCRRQRYWGAPIPIVHCEKCGEVAVPDDQLPVELPELKGADLKPKGVSPLAAATEWVDVDCPPCGGPARRDSDTMDTFVDSSWYFLRYCSPHDDTQAFDPDAGQAVDAVRHLHRRRRARGAAPAVRPLLHQGAARHGAAGLRRAVLGAAEPGHRHQPGQEDEQVAGQRRQSGGPTSGVRRGRGAADAGVRGSARGRHRLGRHGARRLAAVPAAGLAAVRRRHLAGRHASRGRRRRPARGDPPDRCTRRPS